VRVRERERERESVCVSLQVYMKKYEKEQTASHPFNYVYANPYKTDIHFMYKV